ncbi:MAG: LysE family translocator [Burkholderiaceae bacterium]
MPSTDTLLAFFLLALVLGFTPGPDNLFVLVQSAAHGRRAGLSVVLGLCIGLIGHTLAVALGLAAVLAATPLALDAIRLLGALYLLWLAWQAFKAPVDEAADPVGTAVPGRRLVLRGVLMNLGNPKIVLFFLALLPQFADPDGAAVAIQVLWLGGTFIVATLVSFGTIAWLAAMFSRRLRRSVAARRWLNRLSAGVFAALAARLAWITP